MSHPLLDEAIQIAREAGDKIMTIYRRDDFKVRVKNDDSPLTEADMASHNHIVAALEALTPDIPVLSEESAKVAFAERLQWDCYWLVDPLDGTKEFMAGNDEFTVNIALIDGHEPVLGVVGVPAKSQVYYAARGEGAWFQQDGSQPKKIHVRPVSKQDGEPLLTVVASRRHGLEQVQKMMSRLPNYELTSVGSALKMCLVAEGKADLYPRLAPTSEWDTAAAQCVVEEAGGQLVKLDYRPLTYNTKESLLNPFFLTLGDNYLDWQELLDIEEFK